MLWLLGATAFQLNAMYKIIIFLIIITQSYSCSKNKVNYISGENSSDYLIFLKGKDYYSRRNVDSALLYFNEAINLNPRNSEYYFFKALSLEKLRLPDESIQYFDIAISLSDKPVYYNNRGLMHQMIGDYSKAFSDFDKAIQIDSNYSLAIFNKGIAFHYQEKFDSSCYYVKKAYELGEPDAENYMKEYCQR
jgi:tetratricopeptide (TPR) repeat protein